jgi:hypothetical protein
MYLNQKHCLSFTKYLFTVWFIVELSIYYECFIQQAVLDFWKSGLQTFPAPENVQYVHHPFPEL